MDNTTLLIVAGLGLAVFLATRKPDPAPARRVPQIPGPAVFTPGSNRQFAQTPQRARRQSTKTSQVFRPSKSAIAASVFQEGARTAASAALGGGIQGQIGGAAAAFGARAATKGLSKAKKFFSGLFK